MPSLALVILVNISEAAPFAYITNSGNNTVSIIDTTTDRVTATVIAGYAPSPFGQFIGPAQKRCIITSQ